jgi:hypothetical protein
MIGQGEYVFELSGNRLTITDGVEKHPNLAQKRLKAG